MGEELIGSCYVHHVHCRDTHQVCCGGWQLHWWRQTMLAGQMVTAGILFWSNHWRVGPLLGVQGTVHTGALFMAPMDWGCRW